MVTGRRVAAGALAGLVSVGMLAGQALATDGSGSPRRSGSGVSASAAANLQSLLTAAIKADARTQGANVSVQVRGSGLSIGLSGNVGTGALAAVGDILGTVFSGVNLPPLHVALPGSLGRVSASAGASAQTRVRAGLAADARTRSAGASAHVRDGGVNLSLTRAIPASALSGVADILRNVVGATARGGMQISLPTLPNLPNLPILSNLPNLSSLPLPLVSDLLASLGLRVG